MKALGLIALLLLGASGPLRYRFVPGHVYGYKVVEESETYLKEGPGARRMVNKQSSKLVEKLTVISVSNGIAVIDDRQTDGQIEVITGTGVSQSIRPPVHRVIHMMTTGKIVKIGHKQIVGVRDSGGGFLEGLSLPLPDKALQPGMTWSGSGSTRGLDGKPIAVKYTCRYLGEEKRLGRKCAKIAAEMSSAFQTQIQGSAKPAACTLSGSITTWFALDVFLDANIESSIELSIKATSDSGSERVTTIVSRGKQTLMP